MTWLRLWNCKKSFHVDFSRPHDGTALVARPHSLPPSSLSLSLSVQTLLPLFSLLSPPPLLRYNPIHGATLRGASRPRRQIWSLQARRRLGYRRSRHPIGRHVSRWAFHVWAGQGLLVPDLHADHQGRLPHGLRSQLLLHVHNHTPPQQEWLPLLRSLPHQQPVVP